MKNCSKCKKPYPNELFIGGIGRVLKTCAYCREAGRRHDRNRNLRYRDREKRSEYNRRYREENRENKRRYRAENREKRYEYNRRHREENAKRQSNAEMESLFPGMLAAKIAQGVTNAR